ncbi:hypothetical protein TB2_019465 [Malus domestica]
MPASTKLSSSPPFSWQRCRSLANRSSSSHLLAVTISPAARSSSTPMEDGVLTEVVPSQEKTQPSCQKGRFSP